MEIAEEKYGRDSEEWFEAFACDGICLLPKGHDGPHVFTPEDEIEVAFK